MGAWTSARPSIEKKLKELGFKDGDIKAIAWGTPDRNKLKKDVDALIAKKREKEKDVKNALKQIVPGLF